MRRLLRGWILLGFLSACAPQAPTGPQPYIGPTRTMDQVVAQINANNLPLRSLWSSHDFEATLIDADGKSHFVNGRGVLLYRKPYDILLQGKKDFGTVFELGSNDQRYWLTMMMGPETMWWGSYANIGKPCAGEMPVRPDAFMEVLGVGDIDTDFLNQPAPTMRFNNDADAYMFVWSYQLPDRWVAQKEVWYDRQTMQPSLVLLFDPEGRIILRAYLAEHRPVEVPDLPREDWPTVATRYRLYFPDTGSRMTFHLSEMQLQKRGVPNDRTFQFPVNPRVPHVVRVDEGCAD